jgi:hypothetical protein
MVDSSDGWLRVLDGLLSVQSLVMAVVLGYLLGSALRSLLVLVLDKGQSRGQAVWRVLAALFYGGCLAGYWWLTGPMLTWNFHTMLWAGGTALLMVLGFVLLRLLLGHVYQEGLGGDAAEDGGAACGGAAGAFVGDAGGLSEPDD